MSGLKHMQKIKPAFCILLTVNSVIHRGFLRFGSILLLDLILLLGLFYPFSLEGSYLGALLEILLEGMSFHTLKIFGFLTPFLPCTLPLVISMA